MTSVNGRWLVYITVEEAPKHLSPIITATGKDFVRIGTRVDTRAGGPDDTRSGGDAQTKGLQTKTYIAFVAMSFRQEEEPALVDYYRAMERATLKTRFSVKVTRIDLVEGDYEISQKLMDEIDNADIIVTDFTLRPSNVYFELGYARGRRKRIIQTARKDTVLESIYAIGALYSTVTLQSSRKDSLKHWTLLVPNLPRQMFAMAFDNHCELVSPTNPGSVTYK